MKEDDIQEIWEYFQDMYNVDRENEVTVKMNGFDGAKRGNYFRGEPTSRAEKSLRMERHQVRMKLQER